MAEADSVCLKPIDDLFTRECAYTVYENEFTRGELVSPILACEPNNSFVRSLVDELNKIDTSDVAEPWITTGNLFVARMIKKYNPDIVIFPSFTFIPIHYLGEVYNGPGKVYARQMFGSTTNGYQPSQSIIDRIRGRSMRRQARAQFGKTGAARIAVFDRDFEWN